MTDAARYSTINNVTNAVVTDDLTKVTDKNAYAIVLDGSSNQFNVSLSHKVKMYITPGTNMERVDYKPGESSIEYTDTELLQVLRAELSAKASRTYVNNQIADAVRKMYIFKGDATIASLPTPSAETVGQVYNMTEDFIIPNNGKWSDGIGKKMYAGTDVSIRAIVNPDGTVEYKYNIYGIYPDRETFVTEDQLEELNDIATEEEVDELVMNFYK